MIVTCSIECSTLESANWKSKDEAIQMHLSSLKEEANHIKMWSKPTSFTCHDPSNSSEKGRGLKRTSHEGCIEKRVKMILQTKSPLEQLALGNYEGHRRGEDASNHFYKIPSAPFKQQEREQKRRRLKCSQRKLDHRLTAARTRSS